MMARLDQDMILLREEAYVNGAWCPASSGLKFAVQNPADDRVIGEVPDMDASDAEIAIQAAAKAFETWQDTTAKERSKFLRKWFDISEKHVDEIAKIMTAESGKPLAEARGEVAYGNSFLEWFADTVRHIDGEIVPSAFPNKQILLTRQPVGVVAIITPWNFPYAMIARKVGAVLAAGCTCVIRPAEDTPLTALASVALAERAGLPPGVVNVITSSRKNVASIGKVLCEHKSVSCISFTGSTAVGKMLYEQAAKGVKRVSLELGGNAPFIVFPSADLQHALDQAILCRFRNNGQVCVAANRFLVHESIFDDFVEGLARRMNDRLVLGNGMKDGVTNGPLINSNQMSKVTRLVNDALTKGAKAIVGGKPASDIGTKFFQPTLMIGVTPEMDMYHEEIFGPVAVCLKVKDEAEALKIANSTNSGLASYLFSRDVAQVFRVSRKLEFGMVGVNDGIISSPEAPFGGIKESGFGREGSKHGVAEYTYIKYNLISALDK